MNAWIRIFTVLCRFSDNTLPSKRVDPLVFEQIRFFNRNFMDNLDSLFFFFFFLELHMQQMEIAKLGVESALQLKAYTTATAYLSCICNLYHGNDESLTQWARPGIKPTSSFILAMFITRWATMGTPVKCLILSN